MCTPLSTVPVTVTSEGDAATGVGGPERIVQMGAVGAPSPGTVCAPAATIGSANSAPTAPINATPKNFRTGFRTIASSNADAFGAATLRGAILPHRIGRPP